MTTPVTILSLTILASGFKEMPVQGLGRSRRSGDQPFPLGIPKRRPDSESESSIPDPFSEESGRVTSNSGKPKSNVDTGNPFSNRNAWGFDNDRQFFRPGSQNQATTEEPIVLPTTRDPNHSGALSGLGDIGFGYGISVAGVSVASKVGVTFGESGLAGGVPISYAAGQNERTSLNDYDGDKRNIVPDRAFKYALLQRIMRVRQIEEIRARRARLRAHGVDPDEFDAATAPPPSPFSLSGLGVSGGIGR